MWMTSGRSPISREPSAVRLRGRPPMIDQPPNRSCSNIPGSWAPWPDRDAALPACARARHRRRPAPREGSLDGAAQELPRAGQEGAHRPVLPRRFDHAGLERKHRLAAVLRAAERGQLRHRRRPDPARPLADPERRARGHRAKSHRAHDRHQQRRTTTRRTRSPRESRPSSRRLRHRLPKTKVLLLGVFPAEPEARRRPRASSSRSTRRSPGSTTGRTSIFSTSASRS